MSIRIFVLAVMLASILGCSSKHDKAEAFVKEGIENAKKGELDDAITNFNRAIELDSENAEAYFNRGYAKYNKTNLDGAIADYVQSVKLNSNNAVSFYWLGVAKADKGDLDEAIIEYKKAIELNPNSAANFYSLGIAEAKNGELRDYFNTRQGNTNDWPVQVSHFLLDEISQDDFLKAADSTDAKKSREQHCEAYFYIAIKSLRAGNVASAKLFFQQCINTNEKTFYEYRMARIKLKQLEDKIFTQ